MQWYSSSFTRIANDRPKLSSKSVSVMRIAVNECAGNWNLRWLNVRSNPHPTQWLLNCYYNWISAWFRRRVPLRTRRPLETWRLCSDISRGTVCHGVWPFRAKTRENYVTSELTRGPGAFRHRFRRVPDFLGFNSFGFCRVLKSSNRWQLRFATNNEIKAWPGCQFKSIMNYQWKHGGRHVCSDELPHESRPSPQAAFCRTFKLSQRLWVQELNQTFLVFGLRTLAPLIATHLYILWISIRIPKFLSIFFPIKHFQPLLWLPKSISICCERTHPSCLPNNSTIFYAPMNLTFVHSMEQITKAIQGQSRKIQKHFRVVQL